MECSEHFIITVKLISNYLKIQKLGPNINISHFLIQSIYIYLIYYLFLRVD